MAKVLETLKQKNMAVGWLYSYVHFVTEVVCFYFLTKVTGNSLIVWLIPFVYDALSFVPQGLIGKFNDNHPKVSLGVIGTFVLVLAYLLEFVCNVNVMIALIVLCIGNCIMHIAGAESTLRNAEGKLSHSAIFVAGSFGVVTGRLLANPAIPFWTVILLTLTMIPFVLLANRYNSENTYMSNACHQFHYANKNIAPFVVIIVATFVVIVRGYMGYGIPTS